MAWFFGRRGGRGLDMRPSLAGHPSGGKRWTEIRMSGQRNRVAETTDRAVAQTVGPGVCPYNMKVKAECSLASSEWAQMKQSKPR